MLNSHLVDVADLPATLPSLDEESQSVSTDDTASFVHACHAERFGTWAFCTLVRGVEWDPAVFTRIVGECEPKLKMTLESASIFTFACRSRVTPVPSGYVPVEGYLKMQGNNTVLRSTLKRRLQHPDLQNPEDPSRSWGVEWTACRVGRKGRYTDHDFIARFHRETALPPAGVLQRSADAVGPRLRVDFLGPSDAPLNRGGWAARKERQAAADAGAAKPGVSNSNFLERP